MTNSNEKNINLSKISHYTSIMSFILVILQTGYFFYIYYNNANELIKDYNQTVVILFAVSMIMNLGLVIYSIYQTKSYEIILHKNKEFSNVRKQMEKEIHHLNKSIEILSTTSHNVSHNLRKLLSEIYDAIIHNKLNEYESIESKWKQFLQFFVSNVKENFDILTKDPVAVYITLIEKDTSNDNYYAQTLYRDPISYSKRSVIDINEGDYYNTNQFYPFNLILDERNSQNEFVSDNCLSHSAYYDRITNWQEFYNAIICIPIRKYIGTDDEMEMDYYHSVGFIVVDNFKGGFDNEIAIQQLKSFADQLYYLLNIFSDLHEKKLEFEIKK